MPNSPPKPSRHKADPTPLPPIMPGAAYPLSEFRRITKLGTAALRTARKNGLKVRRVGGRGFILGDDFVEFLKNLDDP